MMQVSDAPENARAPPPPLHATTAALEFRLRLSQSFHDKSRQFVGTSPTKKAPARAPFRGFLNRSICCKF
jgi:hypothetical protein